MGFSLEAIVDKVGHKIDKKGNNVSLKPQGRYGQMSNPHVPREPPPHRHSESEHRQDYNNLESFNGNGPPKVGRESRGSITHPKHHHPDQPRKEGNVFGQSAKPESEYFAPPPAAAEPAFTGGGLLGKMMNARGVGGCGRGDSTDPSARQGRVRSSSEVPQRPPKRYKREKGLPRHEDLHHSGGLRPNNSREYQREAGHELRMHGSGSHESRELRNRGSGREKVEEMQNPFDDRESY